MGNERNRLDNLHETATASRRKKEAELLQKRCNALEQEKEDREKEEKPSYREIGPLKIPEGTITLISTVITVGICNTFIPLNTGGYISTLILGGGGGALGRYVETHLSVSDSDD